MKKGLAVVSLMAAFVAFLSPSTWAFQARGKQVIRATANTLGVKTAEFGVKLRPIANPESTAADATTLTWANRQPNSGWQLADQVLKTTWTVTDANGGIQIYTDNKTAGAVPLFVDPTTDTKDANSNPAGLLLGSSGNSSVTLPLAWSVKVSSMVPNQAGTRGIVAADPNITTNPNYYQWFFMFDKQTPSIDRNGDGDTTDLEDGRAFANGDTFDYVNVIKNVGVHNSPAPGDYFSDSDRISYIYLQADLSTAVAQATYSTSRLTIEAYIE